MQGLTYLSIPAAIALALICGGCRHPSIPEEGVSHSLASQRAQDLHDVEYELYFRIPECADSLVYGEAAVSFFLERPVDLVLDFTGADTGNVEDVSVGGKHVACRIGRGHVVVPEKVLVKGRNEVRLRFRTGTASLNRRSDYLYTLLVPERARTLFPCFDQPDIKAYFSLILDVPEGWTAVTGGLLEDKTKTDGREQFIFGKSDKISTYLFAFAAGRWDVRTEKRGDRSVNAYYRETDPAKLAQFQEIFDQVFFSIKWMEDYTGIPMPFQKFDIVIVPAFQFGGMEHPGAVFLSDRRIFLQDNTSTSARLSRIDLIAHETAHMWFGDLVTMRWFDDVWTKEVFANYFASKINAPLQPEVNGALRDFRSFNLNAYSEDRTEGAVPVRQELHNLRYAGLVYGNIVYDKAPVIMRMLDGILGDEAFRDGIREYLRTYAGGNATWPELVEILDRHTPVDLRGWSDVWVEEPGMPEVSASYHGGKVRITQRDPRGRGLVWPQNVDVQLIRQDGKVRKSVTCWLDKEEAILDLHYGEGVPLVVANLSTLGYGYFKMDRRTRERILDMNAFTFRDVFPTPQARLSILASLYEDYLFGVVEAEKLYPLISQVCLREDDALAGESELSYLSDMSMYGPLAGSTEFEEIFGAIALLGKLPEMRRSAVRCLFVAMRSGAMAEELYSIWRTQDVPTAWDGVKLSENDYRDLAYELCIRFPNRYHEICDIQRSRISNPDRLYEWDFVSKSVHPDKSVRDSLLQSFLVPEGRRTESWVVSCLRYLGHPLRQEDGLGYIGPALGVLQDVQRTGDIFFPKNWASALLWGHNSPSARDEVRRYLGGPASVEGYPPQLRSKVLISSDHLFRLDRQKR